METKPDADVLPEDLTRQWGRRQVYCEQKGREDTLPANSVGAHASPILRALQETPCRAKRVCLSDDGLDY